MEQFIYNVYILEKYVYKPMFYVLRKV